MSEPGDLHAAAGTSKLHAGSAGTWGTLRLVQARGHVVPGSSVAPFGIWGCWLHLCCLCLAGSVAQGARAWLKSQTKPERDCGCGGSRVMVVVGAR